VVAAVGLVAVVVVVVVWALVAVAAAVGVVVGVGGAGSGAPGPCPPPPSLGPPASPCPPLPCPGPGLSTPAPAGLWGAGGSPPPALPRARVGAGAGAMPGLVWVDQRGRHGRCPLPLRTTTRCQLAAATQWCVGYTGASPVPSPLLLLVPAPSLFDCMKWIDVVASVLCVVVVVAGRRLAGSSVGGHQPRQVRSGLQNAVD
jgi:hypothetical protein